jgi:hypothetical protein
MRPRCSTKPRLETMEGRLVLSKATIAPPDLAHQLQVQAQRQAPQPPHFQTQRQIAEAAAQRIAAQQQKLNKMILMKQKQQWEAKLAKDAAKGAHHTSTTSTSGFSLSKIWGSIFKI